jgi:hypothetical protein
MGRLTVGTHSMTKPNRSQTDAMPFVSLFYGKPGFYILSARTDLINLSGDTFTRIPSTGDAGARAAFYGIGACGPVSL